MRDNKLKFLLLEVRAPFFTASVLPIVLGSVIAWSRLGRFDWGLFALTLLAGMLFHAGTNVANDYFDHLSGNDEVNREFVRPFTGGSRFIQEGLLKPSEVLCESLVLFIVGSVIGLYLAFNVGVGVLVLGVIGLFSGFFYSSPPVSLVNRGIGEAAIGLNFGVLMTLGGYYVQAGHFAWEPVVASLPLAIMIAEVVFINQFQDMKADAAVGKNHWVVRLGRKRSSRVYALSTCFVYVTLATGVILGITTTWVFCAFLTIPIAVKAVTVALKHYDDAQALVPANALTILLHLGVGVVAVAGYILERLV